MRETEIEKILKEKKTPLYIYDMNVVYKKITELKNAIPVNVELFYSIKANPNTKLLSLLTSKINGFEVASMGEIKKALDTGISEKNIMFVGPGKSYDELEFAVLNRIYLIIVESLDEIEIINGLAEKYNYVVNIALRVNISTQNSKARLKMNSLPRQFGFEEDLIEKVVKIVEDYSYVKIIGVYSYSGTQILDVKNLVVSYNDIFQLAINVQKMLNRNIEFIGFGGGYGVNYFENEKPLELLELQMGLADVFSKYKGFFSEKIRMVSESGRYLVAESGCLVCKVLYKKNIKGTQYLILDGGTNIFAAAIGMGKFLRRNLPVSVLGGKEEDEQEIVNIVGPLCTPMDILSTNVKLPKVKIGDYVIYEKVGAYGLTASYNNFLSHQLPTEVIYESTS